MSDNNTNGDGRNGCRAHQEIDCFMNVIGNGLVVLVLLRTVSPAQGQRRYSPTAHTTHGTGGHTRRPRPCAKGPAHPPFPHHTPPHSSPRPPPPTPRGLHSWSQCYAVHVPQNHESENGGVKDEGGQAAVPHKQKRTKAHPAQRCYGRLEKMHNRSTTQTHWCVKCI